MDKKFKAAASEREKRLRDQVAVIEHVQAVTGLDPMQIAEIVSVKPETIRKYLGGYQPASRQIIQLIEAIPARLAVRRAGNGAKVDSEAAGPGAGDPSARRHFSMGDKLEFVLKLATFGEQAILRAALDELYSICKKREVDQPDEMSVALIAPSEIINFPRGHHLRAILGEIAAGTPREAIQQADEWLAIPANVANQVSFVLRVRGDSMIDAGIDEGDLIYVNSEITPKDGDIVVALIDRETTLKTYTKKKKQPPTLRSENKAFPREFRAVNELTVQGVMIGKHPKP